jgi:hypothetical protein
VWVTFTNGCVLCAEFVQSIGAPLDAGFRELRFQEVQKRSCMIDHSLGVLPQPPAQTCCRAQMTLFMWISASQVGSNSVSNGSAIDSAQQCPPSHKPMNLGGNRQIWLDCAPPSLLYTSSGTIRFSFFGPLKDSLCATRFEEDESMIHAVRIWLCEQETSWYREGMHALA